MVIRRARMFVLFLAVVFAFTACLGGRGPADPASNVEKVASDFNAAVERDQFEGMFADLVTIGMDEDRLEDINEHVDERVEDLTDWLTDDAGAGGQAQGFSFWEVMEAANEELGNDLLEVYNANDQNIEHQAVVEKLRQTAESLVILWEVSWLMPRDAEVDDILGWLAQSSITDEGIQVPKELIVGHFAYDEDFDDDDEHEWDEHEDGEEIEFDFSIVAVEEDGKWFTLSTWEWTSEGTSYVQVLRLGYVQEGASWLIDYYKWSIEYEQDDR